MEHTTSVRSGPRSRSIDREEGESEAHMLMYTACGIARSRAGDRTTKSFLFPTLGELKLLVLKAKRKRNRESKRLPQRLTLPLVYGAFSRLELS
jgi:hypothetical protein